MRSIYNYLSVSKEYNDPSEIDFPDDSILFYSTNYEERTTLFSSPTNLNNNAKRIYVDELENQIVHLQSDSLDLKINLRSNNDSQKITSQFNGVSIFIDITGLTHSSWAWLVRTMMARATGDLWVMYSEPMEYKFHESPFDGQLFDLSERITGIVPLPGFASLIHYTSDNSIFMPLLGFEGARLAHIFEDVQPSRKFTFPVIGVPGFNFDLPFYTYQGNRSTLEREGIWKNWRYEKANCPVSVFVLGAELINEFPDKYLRIALIGTKPHALGAVLLKLSYPNKVDLIYDHPMRKQGRTRGKSKIQCYYMSPFKEYMQI